MKKNIFWKIIVVWFMVLLTIVVFSDTWHYSVPATTSSVAKINKLTGHIQVFSATKHKWIRVDDPKITSETKIKTTEELFPKSEDKK